VQIGITIRNDLHRDQGTSELVSTPCMVLALSFDHLFFGIRAIASEEVKPCIEMSEHILRLDHLDHLRGQEEGKE
jgi:hypothetical protein